MFCKWCGGKLTPSDTSCKRCGKEVPALSDCGGFYDLVSNEKKNAEKTPFQASPAAAPQVFSTPAASSPVIPPPVVHSPVVIPSASYMPYESKKTSKQSPAGLFALIIVLVLATAILILTIFLGKPNKQAKKGNIKPSGSVSSITTPSSKQTTTKPSKESKPKDSEESKESKESKGSSKKPAETSAESAKEKPTGSSAETTKGSTSETTPKATSETTSGTTSSTSSSESTDMSA